MTNSGARMTRGNGVEQNHDWFEQLGDQRGQRGREAKTDAQRQPDEQAGECRHGGGAEMGPQLAGGHQIHDHPTHASTEEAYRTGPASLYATVSPRPRARPAGPALVGPLASGMCSNRPRLGPEPVSLSLTTRRPSSDGSPASSSQRVRSSGPKSGCRRTSNTLRGRGMSMACRARIVARGPVTQHMDFVRGA